MLPGWMFTAREMEMAMILTDRITLFDTSRQFHCSGNHAMAVRGYDVRHWFAMAGCMATKRNGTMVLQLLLGTRNQTLPIQ